MPTPILARSWPDRINRLRDVSWHLKPHATDLSTLPRYIATPDDARRILQSITLRDLPTLRIVGTASTISAQLAAVAAMAGRL